MSKKKIFLYISDVASFIGQNNYDFVTPFERLWKKCDSVSYAHALSQAKGKLDILQLEVQAICHKRKLLQNELDNKKITKRQHAIAQAKLDSSEQDALKKMVNVEERIDEIDLTQQQRLEKLVGPAVILDMQSAEIETAHKRSQMNVALDGLDIPEEKKEDVKKIAESYINKTHGTLKENDAISMFEDKFKVKLDTSQQFFKAYLQDASACSKFDWYICGKVDGLYINQHSPHESYIVEVKNRTRGFFNSLRDYEKTQIQLYMWMLDQPATKLVEQHNNKLRITEVYRDNEYVEDVLKYLAIFVKQFDNRFLQDEEMKREYILKTHNEKRIFLQKLYFDDIKKAELSCEQDENQSATCMIDDDL